MVSSFMFIWSKLASAKWRDAWEERFLGPGRTNAVITEIAGRRTIRIEVYCQSEREARFIHRQFGGSVRNVAARDLAPPAQPPAKPLRIRGRLVVVNSAEAAASPDHGNIPTLAIPAEMAFGTGDHATTSTCLRFLVDAADDLARQGREGWSMADLGSGTGILALAGRRLGAASALGLDNDPEATRAARGNARRNRVKQATFETADLLLWKPPHRFDVVAANVFSTILIQAMPILRKAVAPHGHLLLSGILKAQAEEVAAAAVRHGFAIHARRTIGKWATLHARAARRP